MVIRKDFSLKCIVLISVLNLFTTDIEILKKEKKDQTEIGEYLLLKYCNMFSELLFWGKTIYLDIFNKLYI